MSAPARHPCLYERGAKVRLCRHRKCAEAAGFAREEPDTEARAATMSEPERLWREVFRYPAPFEAGVVVPLSRWACIGCGRTSKQGARPTMWKGKPSSDFCTRCQGRLYRRGDHRIPLDAPEAHGPNAHDRAAVRAYWERRIWDAAMAVAELPTEEETDPEFVRARTAYFALVALASRYLRATDYLRTGTVPSRYDCPTGHDREVDHGVEQAG